ncbi:tryptophan synthase subunit alpha [Peptoniphilus sp. MSJ-1]|uniref:Tryptophan synthase alpha chain n=1 Tax=Peptoniphilus ovalis TaxID=2841503 RepID=A0ABS6FGS3_9FIRM|nr:tryptophan synthase subunit alpha [Peptoniphilus ovalis]MBU5669369.1 tryptophan synthase subunit alpha [Peptoniphilus ovalis]
MSRIKEAFKNKKAFIAFITCGDPNLEVTKEIILEMVEKGVDLIELGIPFSDPTAEGPVIQEANYRALKGGVTTDKIFEFVKDLRNEISIPLVFMTYSNVIFSYGSKKFSEKCKEVGIDGIILPDLPYEEKDEFYEVFKNNNIDLISMIAPTSEDRIKKIAKEAEGFIYIVSSLGVTGTRKNIDTNLEPIIKSVRKNSKIPAAIGFGISNAKSAKKMASISDGIIIGSAIMKIIKEYGEESPKYVGEFVREIKQAIN